MDLRLPAPPLDPHPRRRCGCLRCTPASLAAAGPKDRYGATLTGFNDRAFLFGGSRRAPNHVVNELWVFTLEHGWQLVVPNQPSFTLPIARNYHSAALFVRDKLNPAFSALPFKRGVVMFAGADCSGSCVCRDDTWVYDLDANTWLPVDVPTLPATRYHQTLVGFEGVFYAFGGESFKPKYMYHNSVLALQLIALSSSSYWLYAGIAATALAVILLSAAIARKLRRPTRDPSLPTNKRAN